MYYILQKILIVWHFCECEAVDGEIGLDASPKSSSCGPAPPLADAQMPLVTYSEQVESVGSVI